MGPLLFKPNYISPIWSGPNVNRARGLAEDELYGESFDISAHEGLVTCVDGGPFDGMPLDRLIHEHGEEVMGRAAGQDGVVQVVTMDARESLSVQVHPGEAYAQVTEGDHEKSESWYILSAEPGASIICGSTTDDVDALRAAAADDTIGERFGRRVPVNEGDFVLIPAGTLHALGAGVFAVEVGSLGFKTYRICDWGRGRELHVEDAFNVLDTSLRPEPCKLGVYDPSASAPRRRAVSHGLFWSDVIDVRGSCDVSTEGVYQLVTCVAGEVALRVGAEDGEGSEPEAAPGGLVLAATGDPAAVPLPFTRSALIPASAGTYTIEGTGRVLVSAPVVDSDAA